MNPLLLAHPGRRLAAVFAALLATGCATSRVDERTPATGARYQPPPAAFRVATLELGERVPPALRTPEVRLSFATTRRPAGGSFGDEPDGAMHLGQLTMRIGPAAATWDDLLDWARLNEQQVPPVRVTLGAVERHGYAGLGAGAASPDARFLAGLEPMYAHGGRRVLLFVHGSDTSFAEAAATLACMHHHQGRRGASVLFAWPRGSEQAGDSANALARLLALLSGPGRVGRIDCLVNSDGAAILKGALRQLEDAVGRDGLAALHLGTFVLALPDVALDGFGTDDVALAAAAAGRTVVYSRRQDRLLGLSGWWRGQGAQLDPQVRDSLMARRDRIEFVDVTNVPGPRDAEGFTRHGAWYGNPLVVTDALLTLLTGDAAAERGLVRGPDELVWTLPPDYAQRVAARMARTMDGGQP